MLPIERLSEDEASRLSGLLFDLDDTVLDHGKLAVKTYEALGRLSQSGFLLVAVTGRPSSWGAVLARQWPVSGVVCENGALAHFDEDGRVKIWDEVPEKERRERRARLSGIAEAVQKQLPDLRHTDDAVGRVTDVTFDIGEYRRVAPDTVARAVGLLRELGARTLSSSVHLHATLEGHDKASGSTRFLEARFGLDPTASRSRFAFIGDSENDAACFAAFRTTFAVANLRGRPTVNPRFVTREERGAGFAEAVEVLLARRKKK